jgi:hypothetical protein
VLIAAPRPQRWKKGQKVEIFRVVDIFSKVEVQKLNVSACLSRLIKRDKKK